jgi:hypothetical protein
MKDTLTEIGSKWPKKKKRRSEVWENEPLDEKIEENRSSKEDGSWTTQQAGKIHQWMLWSTSRERRKDRLAKPRKRGSS